MRRLKVNILMIVLTASAVYIGMPAASNANPAVGSPQMGFLIPDNVILEARLNQRLRAERLNDGSRFTMTVTSPSQYRGAVIHGYVADARRSGRMTGRSELVLNFDRIRHRNRDYRFAGLIESVRTSGGERVSVDREGVVRDGSQTDRTVGRTAVGAVAGTIIGAIAGGGSGAATGAVVGGGLGAGSVLVQGRNNMDLRRNSMVTIRSSAPR